MESSGSGRGVYVGVGLDFIRGKCMISNLELITTHLAEDVEVGGTETLDPGAKTTALSNTTIDWP